MKKHLSTYTQRLFAPLIRFRRAQRRKKISVVFHLIGWSWVLSVSAFVLQMMYGTLTSESTLYLGWRRVMERYNPFNILNILLIIVLLIPAIASFLVKERFDDDADSR